MLDKASILSQVQNALREDIGTGDVSAALLPYNLQIHAVIISREPMVVAGRPWVEATFREIDPDIRLKWEVEEGQVLKQGQPLCRIQGQARAILTAERTALNFLQTLSATATKTRAYVEAIQHTQTKLLDTRKTLPGLRRAQKYAVQCGGGVNHRVGLFDAYLIKENHIRALGTLSKAVEFAKNKQDGLFIEVEVENLEELALALEANPDRILLDNFSLPNLRKAVEMNQPKRCELEASGGVTLENIALIAETGVDWISVGDLTKSLKAIDLSLLVEEE